MADKNMNAKISVDFEESASRQSLNSGDSLPTLFGKTKKFFSDLKPVALSGSYDDLTDTPESSSPVLNTSTGNPITVTDGADAPLIEFNLYGDSTQDGTPTPDTPIDIISVGDDGAVGITSRGKNLFDFEAWKKTVAGAQNGTVTWFDNGFTLTETANSADCFNIPSTGSAAGSGKITVKPNTTYTLSWSADSDMHGLVYVFLNGNISVETHVSNKSAKKLTFGTHSDTTYVNFRFGVNTPLTSITYSNIQLEEGNTVTLYEPYKGSTATITSGLPLCSVGDVRDELIYNADGTGKIVKRTTKFELDGTLSKVTDYVPEHPIATVRLPNSQPCTTQQTANMYCNRFKPTTASLLYDGYTGIALNGTYLWLNVDNTIADVESANLWLAANPITLLYQLENPIEIELSAAEMAELMQLQTFDGVTNIYNDEYAEMSVKYWCDGNINALLNNKAPINHTHTATDVGLGNVENKSSATIRSEITSDNVTDALGFTPMEDTTVPITKGGTGATTVNAAEYNISGNIVEGGGDFADDSRIACVYKTPSSANGVFFYQTVPKLWNYIKGKISSVLGLTATQYNGNAKTATNATKVNNHTVESDVPANAVFTDTTYTHPNSGVTAGTYRSVTVNAQGHVTGGSNPTVTIAQGGTGATTAKAAEYNLLKDIPESTTALTDNAIFVFKKTTPDSTNGVFVWKYASLIWNYIKGKADSVYATLSHTHTKSEITDMPTTMANPNALTVKLNSGTTEGTNMFTYTGSAVKSVNITPSSIGAAASSHGTHVTFDITTPKANGTAAVGSATTVSRSDHVHPLQTSVSGSSGSCTGNAATATALTTSAGSATQPIYFSDGKPVKTTYTLGKSVPSDAKFTDTTYSAATTSANGLMTTTMVTKLNGIAEGANKTTVDTAISSTSTNPVQNKIIKTELDKKLDKSGGTMTGVLVAQSNADYTIAQVRNVTMSTEAASGGSNGQIHYQYE